MQQKSLRALQALSAILAVALIGLSALHFTGSFPEPAERSVRRFSFAPEGVADAAISPDGKYMLYAAQTDGESSLWLRSLSDESAREVAGSAGAIGGFWSSDSLSIGFAVGAPDYQLKGVSINGGKPIALCELPSRDSLVAFSGGTWSPDDERIVFSSGLRLYEVAARGGQPHSLFDPGDSPRPESLHPHFLPTRGWALGTSLHC